MEQTAQTRTFPARAGVHSYLPACLWRWLLGGLCLFGVASAGAETAAADAKARAIEAAEARVRTWVIPAGPLSAALTDFAAQSGLYLAGASARAEGKSSPGLNGRYPTRQALARLLADSRLSYRFVDAGTVTLEPDKAEAAPAPLPLLRVGGEAVPQPSGGADSAYRVERAIINVLGNKTLKDTPYTIEVYSNELIENRQSRSLAGLAKFDASLSLMADNLTDSFAELTIRGVGANGVSNRKIDGLHAGFTNNLPLEHMERVDILKGASGFLYGVGWPGGVVNYIMKRPTDQPYRSLGTQVMDSNLILVYGDVGGRLGTGSHFGYRINLVHELGDTYINDGESRRRSGSIALDYQIMPNLVWRLDTLAAEHIVKGSYTFVRPNADGSLSRIGGRPLAPIHGSRRLAPLWARATTQYITAATDVSWGFAEDWTLTLAHRRAQQKNPIFNQPFITSDFAGNYSIAAINMQSQRDYIQWQGVVNGVFTTHWISHELAVGTSYMHTLNALKTGFRGIPNVGNLSNPIEVDNPFNSYDFYMPQQPYSKRNEYMREMFLSDTLRLSDDWDIIIGLRHSSIETHANYYANVYDKSAITPTLAVTFRPVNGLSLYGNYIEALVQGGMAPDTAINAGEVFPPNVSKQYEFGAKAEYDDWSASAALFRLERALNYTTPANVFTQDGEARYQGLELNGKFHFGRHWLLTTSAMWLDATNQKTTGGALDGKRIVGVAREQFRLYGEYRMSDIPLTLTAGACYEGKRFVDPSNRFYVGNVALFDLGARYEAEIADQKLTLRFNVENLADKAYWLTPSTVRLRQGQPRTFKLGVQIEF